jgi:hypothetical protein
MASKKMFNGRDICLCYPVYKDTNAGTFWNAFQLAIDLGRDQVRGDMEPGDAMIYHARNKLATRFLATGAEWSLWIDSDIIVPTGRATWYKWITNANINFPDEIAGLHTVTRLLSHGKTIVSGTYFGRQRTGKVVSSAHYVPEQEQAARRMDDGIIPVDWVGFGCVLVHRSVFLDIQKKFPDRAPNGRRTEWNFFQPGLDTGEDVEFCRIAKQAGHQVWLDTRLQCFHVGYCCFWSGNTGEEPSVKLQ